MDSLLSLRRQVAAFLEGAVPLRVVQDALNESLLDIHEHGSAEEEKFAGDVLCLTSEFGYGHRDERSLRRELGRLMRADSVARPEPR